MATPTRTGKGKLRGKGQEEKTPTGPISIRPPTGIPELSPEVRDELTRSMQELLLKTHELSFEYSTLDCEEITNCPLAQKSKELFKVVKAMHQILRKITTPS